MIDQKILTKSRNLEVRSDGICRNTKLDCKNLFDHFPDRKIYDFDNFINDIYTLIELTSEDLERIQIATILTRRFILKVPQIIDLCPPPDLEKCYGNRCLYKDSDSKFRVNLLSWLPQTSNVHCHGSWSIVAFLGDATTGRELNYFWRREDDGSKANHAVVKPVSKKILEAGDIIGFTSDAIHNIKSLPPKNNYGDRSDKPTLMFNIFGESNPDKQYLFNPFDNTYKYY